MLRKSKKNKAVSRATDDFSHINTFNQIKKYEKNYNLNKSLSLFSSDKCRSQLTLSQVFNKNFSFRYLNTCFQNKDRILKKSAKRHHL